MGSIYGGSIVSDSSVFKVKLAVVVVLVIAGGVLPAWALNDWSEQIVFRNNVQQSVVNYCSEEGGHQDSRVYLETYTAGSLARFRRLDPALQSMANQVRGDKFVEACQ